MGLLKYAEEEMNRVWPESEPMQDMVKKNIMEMIEVFAKQGHSGTSAPYVLNLFNTLARFNPITPLTGEDDEWMSVDYGCSFQNIRCYEVFKDKATGEAYWSSGRIFREPNGVCYTSSNSRVPITFPWTKPEPEIVDVDELGNEIVKE